MPRGPLSFLSGLTRLSYPFIQLGQRLGETIERVGQGMIRFFGRVDAGELRRVALAEERLRGESRLALGRPLNELIPDELIPEGLTKMRRQFTWTVFYRFVDPRTGRRADRFLNLSVERRLTAQEALEEARQMLEREYGIDPSFLIEERITRLQKAAPGRRL